MIGIEVTEETKLKVQKAISKLNSTTPFLFDEKSFICLALEFTSGVILQDLNLFEVVEWSIDFYLN